MNRRFLTACAGVPLAAALGGVALASAHGLGHGATGTITSLSTTSLTVQLKNGTSVTDGLTPTTRVSRDVAGTPADLTAGTSVSLTLTSVGSTTVTAVHLEAARTKPASTTKTHTVSTTTTHGPKVHTGTPPKTTSSTKALANVHAGGKIVSATDTTFTVADRQGKSVTYTLANTSKISKTVAGTLGDLKVGQTVRVDTAHGTTTAAGVFIVNA